MGGHARHKECCWLYANFLRPPRNPQARRRVLCAPRQLLEAVDYLHSRWVMSRDLKLPNLLLTGDGRLKICDFGLARYFHAFEEPYTPRVVTLWYRCATKS